MKNNSLGKTAILTLFLVGFGWAVYATAVPQQQARDQQNAAGFSYAELTIQGEDNVVWDLGGNVAPRSRTLAAVYYEQGGNQRVTIVNLLNELGNDGWELIQVGENVWTFKRKN